MNALRFFNTSAQELYKKSPNGQFYGYYRIKKHIFFQTIAYLYEIAQRNTNNTVRIADVGGYIWLDIKLIQNYVKTDPLLSKLDIRYCVIDRNLHDFYATGSYERFEWIDYIEEDLTEISVDDYANTFDIIISSEVIEHIWDIEKEVFFKRLNTIMKDDSLLIISNPNSSSLFKNLYHILHKNNPLVQEMDFTNIEHHKGVPSIAEVTSLFVRKGFLLEKILPTSFFSILTRWSICDMAGRIKNIPIVLLDFLLINPVTNAMRIAPLFSSTNVFIGRKKHAIDMEKWYNQEQNLSYHANLRDSTLR